MHTTVPLLAGDELAPVLILFPIHAQGDHKIRAQDRLMDAPSTETSPLEVRILRSAEGDVVTVELTGELDRGTSRRLCAAVALARRVAARAVIVDTTGLTFVDLGGYRSLLVACGRPQRKRPLNVVLVPGHAIHRLQGMLARCDGAATPPGDATAAA